MSRTQSMRSQRSLKTGSRRNRRALVVFALLTAFGARVHAQQITVSALVGLRSVSVDITLVHDGRVVLESLNRGMRSQVTFEIRLYRPLDGIAGLLGDRLVAEYHPSYVAFRDVFTREYVIESPVGAQRRFESADAFLSEFFAIRTFPIPTDTITDVDEHYLLAQVVLRPVMLVDALRLLDAVRPGESVVTPWTRVELRSLRASL
jgi:hypothetical protein